MGIADASYHTDDNSVCGEMILLESKKTEMLSPLFWKSGIILRVCTSLKAVETRALVKVVDDTTSFARQLTRLLSKRLSVKIFTDLRPLLESIGSSSQIEEKTNDCTVETAIGR